MLATKKGKRHQLDPNSRATLKRSHSEKDKPETTSKLGEKKRTRPVTQTFPIVEESDSELDGLEVESGGEEEGGGVDSDIDDEPIDEAAMDVDGREEGGPKSQKDPNAARESHKAQKALLGQRKAAKPNSSLLSDAKRLWSLARQKNIPSSDRQKHVGELMNVIRGKVKDIVLKHDASRIVQTVVKYGRQKERDEVALELKGRYKELAQNKYSKFLVSKLIRLCPTHRASILQEFQSNVLRLLLHREASSVLADAFELHANAYERSFLLRDFYGKEALLFGMTKGSIEDKERAKKGLAGIMEGADDGRRKRTLSGVQENLSLIFNNPDKGAVTHAVVHRALWEYISAINALADEVEQEKMRRETFESCQELLAEMVHTKDGSRVVREFLAQGTAKDRKQILKVLKPHIERMCLDDEAQLVLFTALDVIDDTKLLSKSLISEITTPIDKIYETPQGLRALLYLLTPRSRRHFMPAQIASLEETDSIRARTSKKDPQARITEIRKFASEALIQWMAESGAKAAKKPRGSLLVTEIMLYAEGDKSVAGTALLKMLVDSYPSSEGSEPHPIDLSWTSRLFKTLLQGGHYDKKSQSIEVIGQWDALKFAASFVDIVPRNVMVAMCTQGERNGGFVVATLCETLVAGGEETTGVRETLKSWFGEKERAEIGNGKGRGKDLLLQNLALL